MATNINECTHIFAHVLHLFCACMQCPSEDALDRDAKVGESLQVQKGGAHAVRAHLFWSFCIFAGHVPSVCLGMCVSLVNVIMHFHCLNERNTHLRVQSLLGYCRSKHYAMLQDNVPYLSMWWEMVLKRLLTLYVLPGDWLCIYHCFSTIRISKLSSNLQILLKESFRRFTKLETIGIEIYRKSMI